MRTNLTKKLIAYLFLPVYLICFLPLQTEAWGPEGHRIVALIAEDHLSSKARQEIKKLLKGTPIDSVAKWADDIRGLRPETYNWHFVDIPINKRTYKPTRDCKCTRRGDCVIEAIEQLKVILADTTEKAAQRAEALKFIVHFVGDLHQPLHCADNNDRGGNDVKVQFFGESSNLHKVWDSGIIEKTGVKDSAYAAKLNAALASENLNKLESGTVVNWALESHKAAVVYAYGKKPGNNMLDSTYFNQARPIVDTQLMKAGVRLARVINEAF